AAGEPADDVGGIEDAGFRDSRLAAGETESERARMLAGGDGGRQKAGEERLVSSVGEVAGGVSAFPESAREDAGEVRGAAGAQTFLGDIPAKSVERHQQEVVRAEEGVDVDHGIRRVSGEVATRGWLLRPVEPGSIGPQFASRFKGGPHAHVQVR